MDEISRVDFGPPLSASRTSRVILPELGHVGLLGGQHGGHVNAPEQQLRLDMRQAVQLAPDDALAQRKQRAVNASVLHGRKMIHSARFCTYSVGALDT